MPVWKRPDSVPYPKVWRRATGRKPVDGKVPSFVIQDVPEDRDEELMDFMEKHFTANEPLSKCLDMANDVESMNYVRQSWKELISQRVSVVAFLEDDDGPRPRIVGAYILGVVSKGDNEVQRECNGECEKKIIKLLNVDLKGKVEPLKIYGVDEYIKDMGLTVVKEYQGQGLGKELLKTTVDIGRAVGLKLTVTSFTATESQVLAEREGFEELARINYADYKVDGKEVFPRITSECVKLMAKRIE